MEAPFFLSDLELVKMNKAYKQDIDLFTGHKQSLFKRTIYGISHLWFPYVCDVRSGAIFEIQLKSVKN